MIKSEFTFFQVQSKRCFADTSELIEPPFSDGPEVLNAVDMIRSVIPFPCVRWFQGGKVLLRGTLRDFQGELTLNCGLGADILQYTKICI